MQVPRASPELTNTEKCAPLRAHQTSEVSLQRYSGLLLTPELHGVGDVLAALPKSTKTHPLNFVPKHDSDSCVLSIRQLLLILQQAGFVISEDCKTHRGISPSAAIEACHLACFHKTSAPVSHRRNQISQSFNQIVKQV